jgi:hypothetical protein
VAINPAKPPPTITMFGFFMMAGKIERDASRSGS